MNPNPRVRWALLSSPLWILALPVIVIASSVTIPNLFSANTVADASQVNANFAAVATGVNDLEAGRARLFSSTDSNISGTTEAAVGQKELNAVTFTAPTAGFLLITGNVFINNNDVSTNNYTMVPKLDGTNLAPSIFACNADAGADGGGAEKISLSYTIATPVTAGPHTVSHTVGPNAGTASWFHNAERLTVLFLAPGVITAAPSPLILEPGSPTGD